MNDIHKLAREHLYKDNRLSGMPGQMENPLLTKLHLNLNYFSDSDYVTYPLDVNENICRQFIDFLKEEALWKETPPPLFLEPGNLLFLSVSNAIDLIIRAFCEPLKDSVCIANPTFPLYAFCANNHNNPVIDIPLEGSLLNGINVSKIIASKSKVLFIPIPNNPVGTVPKKTAIVELLNNYKGLIVLDEAYIEYADEGSFIEYLEHYPNLVVLRSFSKIWGHAGIRCGVVVGSEMMINTLKKILPPCFFPSHTQEVLGTILAQPAKVEAMREKAKTERQKLEKDLQEIPQVRYVYPSQSNFLLVEFFDGPSIYEKLLKNGVLVKNLHSLIPNTLRISLGKSDENISLLQVLRAKDQINPRDPINL